jgi:hypothetical protein
MLGLLVFAVVACVYFTWMLTMFTRVPYSMRVAAIFLIVLNIILLLTGMFKNPGIPQSLVDKVLKD